ncbi:MAG: YkgJ family cysteine cluster protein, partial [Deltaproteobacteria bacterium]|nr:YkgJ family cysteine cluster protein [Deltaproteobacteria bacterium]
MKHIDKKNDFFRKYEEIRSQTLKFHLEFDKRHINFMCKKGCSDCCESFSLLPVEYYYIKSRLCKLNITNSPSGDNKCVFLKESECLIYDLRPLMCITQGLP